MVGTPLYAKGNTMLKARFVGDHGLVREGLKQMLSNASEAEGDRVFSGVLQPAGPLM